MGNVLAAELPLLGLFAKRGVDRPPPLLHRAGVLPHHGANQIQHRPALKLRALESALVVGDHARGVRSGAARKAQQIGRDATQQGQFLGRRGRGGERQQKDKKGRK